jgi:hypothetical protein
MDDGLAMDSKLADEGESSDSIHRFYPVTRWDMMTDDSDE